MQTLSHLWQYFAEFFFDCEMYQMKVIEEIKTHFMFNNFFPRISCRIWDDVEKYGDVREATNDNAVWLMRFARRISKATRAQAHNHVRAHTAKYAIPILFPRQQWFRERTSLLHYTYIACHVRSCWHFLRPTLCACLAFTSTCLMFYSS